MGLRKPIVAFPKRAIEDICKVEINKEAFLQRKDPSKEEIALFDHMFEIYLREDYEDVYKYRDEEHQVLQEIRSRTHSRDVS